MKKSTFSLITILLFSSQCFAQSEDEKIESFVNEQFRLSKVQTAYTSSINIGIYQRCKFTSSIALIDSSSISDKEKRMMTKFTWAMMNKGLEKVEQRFLSSGYTKKSLEDQVVPHMNQMISFKKSGNTKGLSKMFSDCRIIAEDILEKLGYD